MEGTSDRDRKKNEYSKEKNSTIIITRYIKNQLK